MSLCLFYWVNWNTTVWIYLSFLSAFFEATCANAHWALMHRFWWLKFRYVPDWVVTSYNSKNSRHMKNTRICLRCTLLVAPHIRMFSQCVKNRKAPRHIKVFFVAIMLFCMFIIWDILFLLFTGKSPNFCLQKSRMAMGRIGIFCIDFGWGLYKIKTAKKTIGEQYILQLWWSMHCI